jgi:hypothetical protein
VPILSVADGFGLVIDASPPPDALSLFSKYLRDPGVVAGVLHNPKPIQGIQVGQDPFDDLSVGISFTQPVNLGAGDVQLTINPALVGTLGIHKGEALFDSADEPFSGKVLNPDPARQAFVSAGIEAKLVAGTAGGTGVLQFGLTAGTAVALTNYRLFALTDEIVPAIQTLFRSFVVPGDLQDVESMAPGTVAAVEGTGSLTFSATANLLSAVNPLASLSAPVLNGLLMVRDGAALPVYASYTLTGEYQVRVQRLGGRKFLLGYGKKRGSDFDVCVTAEFGASVDVGGFDLIQHVLQVISSDVVPDQDVFRQAGLGDDQISGIAAAVKAGIERSLALSLKGDLDVLDEVSTAFSYEVDLDALDDAGRQAIGAALRGDLSGLESSTLNGVKPLKSVFSSLREGRKGLKVNLLGIFNYGSVSTLLQKGTIIVDRESGAITITDQESAKRVQSTADYFAQDNAKLRKVLAESFLTTATYRSSGTVLQAPDLTSNYWFFDFHQNGQIANLQDYLSVAQALKFVSPAEVSATLQRVQPSSPLGPVSLYLDSQYTEALFKVLFLDAQGNARPQQWYEELGRDAMISLIEPGAPISDARRSALGNQEIWNVLCDAGPANFPVILEERGFEPAAVPVVTSDYIAIRWWASAMHEMGDALAQLLTFMGRGSPVNPTSPEFTRLRRNLDDKLASVAANTHDHFAEPWGLVVMDLASGQRSAVSFRINCPKLSLTASRGV